MQAQLIQRMTQPQNQWYDKHAGEHPFRLNGTDWARLVQMRLFREYNAECSCKTCTDFLTRIHSIGSPIYKETESVQRAMNHWFLHNPKDALEYTRPREETAGQHSLHALTRIVNTPATLLQVEQNWLHLQKKV